MAILFSIMQIFFMASNFQGKFLNNNHVEKVKNNFSEYTICVYKDFSSNCLYYLYTPKLFVYSMNIFMTFGPWNSGKSIYVMTF